MPPRQRDVGRHCRRLNSPPAIAARAAPALLPRCLSGAPRRHTWGREPRYYRALVVQLPPLSRALRMIRHTAGPHPGPRSSPSAATIEPIGGPPAFRPHAHGPARLRATASAICLPVRWVQSPASRIPNTAAERESTGNRTLHSGRIDGGAIARSTTMTRTKLSKEPRKNIPATMGLQEI